MLQENYITELLDLKSAKVIKSEFFHDRIEICIEFLPRPHECPACGYVTSIVHDYRNQCIKDIPIQGKTMIINYRKRRYRCPCCEKKFAEKQLLIPRYHRLTNRFAYHLIEQMKEKRSIKDIALSNGVSSTKILRMLKIVCFTPPARLPRVLSIDEFKGNAGSNKFQCILTDPENKRLIDILPGRETHILSDYFKRFNDRSSVKFIVMDMNKAYLEMARTYFPNAKIIIDRFHVARYNTWAFENVRRSEQGALKPELRKYFKRSRKLLLTRMGLVTEENKEAVNMMLKIAPGLTNAYLLKEKFYLFMDSESSQEARIRLREFILMAEFIALPEYKACVRMLHNWSEYILNSFDYRYSNGYTEGTNNLIKVIKRVAFGYRNFINMRQRIFLIASKTG